MRYLCSVKCNYARTKHVIKRVHVTRHVDLIEPHTILFLNSVVLRDFCRQPASRLRFKIAQVARTFSF